MYMYLDRISLAYKILSLDKKMANRTFSQPPTQSQTNYLRTDNAGGYAYYPDTIKNGLNSTSVHYQKVGNTIHCQTFADLKQLYEDINAVSSPPVFQMGTRWIMIDLNQNLDFQVNGELIQRLRLVKRNTFEHTNQDRISDVYETFYVPTYVAFDASDAQSVFDSVYVSRIG